MYPTSALGVTEATGGALDGTTGTLTAAGLAAFPELKGPVPFDTGTYGYGATVDTGAPYTPFLTERGRQRPGRRLPAPEHRPAGRGLRARAQLRLQRQPAPVAAAGARADQLGHPEHPPRPLPQLLRPGHRRHLHRRQRVELPVPVHPGGHRPAGLHLPGRRPGRGPGSAPGVPADVQMSAADVAYVVNWEQQTGIKLNLAFNGVGACTAPDRGGRVERQLHRQRHRHGTTYTDPGQVVDASDPNDAGAGQRPARQPGRLQLDHPHLVAPVPRLHRVAAAGAHLGHGQRHPAAPSRPAPTATRSPRPPPTASRSPPPRRRSPSAPTARSP